MKLCKDGVIGCVACVCRCAALPVFYVVITSLLAIFGVAALQPKALAAPAEPCYEQEVYLLSPYDDMLHDVAERYNLDWRMLSALAAVESRFDAKAVSRSGAVGLMQIMPHVAAGYGYTAEQLTDAKLNAEISAMLICSIYKMLRLPADVPERDRLSFMLGCYNAGYSRVADAMALAEYYGDNRYAWDRVAYYLELLAEPEFYESEVVQNGRFTGSRETLGHVRKVLRRYNQYVRRAKRASKV